MNRPTLALASLVLFGGVAGAAERPNFVFLFADDQRYDAMSVVQKEQGDKGRFPWFKTPNMDRLAAEGVRFRNAFAVNALCAPSRACFLTGRYSHANGVCNNRTPLSAELANYASVLRSAGYATGYVGKWHQDSQADRPGFDWYASFVGQGAYTNANFLVNGKPERSAEWTDDRSAGYAVRFLETERPKDRPFVLAVGFKAPHGPFTPPKRLATAFAGELARGVPSLGVPPGFNTDLGRKKDAGGKTVKVNLGYFRCIAGVDDNVGKVLGALDRLQLAANTVVVYASDNGFYFGEHTLADKRSGYDESMRIPLIVRYPKSGLKGVTRDDLVLNIDLAPTFLDLAGVAVPKEMQGKSWKPLLAKEPPKGPFRASFFYEYFRERGPKKAPANAVGGYNTPTMTGVRTPTHKLLKYRDHPEWTELFDLAADPYELKNQFNAPGHAGVRAKLEKEYDRLAKELGYTIPADVPAEPKR